jgi:membrane-associated phospholipid phosphatase
VLAAVFWAGATTTEGVAHPPAWTRVLGEIGGWVVLPTATILVGVVFALTGRRRAAALVVGAVAGAGILAYVAKVLLQVIGADEDGGRISDFPSTHAAVIVGLTGALAVVVWRANAQPAIRALAVAAAVTVSVVMGESRIAEGSHSTIDVVGGAVLGLAWLSTLVLALSSLRGRRAWLVVVLTVSLAGFAVLAVAYDQDPFASIDQDVADRVAQELPLWCEWLARPFSWLGGWIGLTILGVVASVLLLRARAWLDLAFFLFAFLGSQLAVSLVKEVFDRPRPDAGSAVPLPDSMSFPSGHAAAGTASLGAVAILVAERAPPRARVAIWCAAAVLGVAIGVSRIALNVHYVTDVLAGWCFGLAWLAACLIVRDLACARMATR